MSVDFKFPDVGEGITEGELVKWRVKEGDEIKQHDIIAEVETDKAVVEIPSPVSGKILKLYHKAGDTVKVGESLVSIGNESETAPSKPAPEIKQPEIRPGGVVGYLEEAPDEDVKSESKPSKGSPSSDEGILVLPSVRRLARDLGVNLLKISGTGHEGRVTEEDVRKAAQSIGTKKIEESLPEIEAKVQKKYDMYGYIERVPLKGVRKSIAKHMVDSLFTAPHVTHMDEADVTRLHSIREKEKIIAQRKGVKLTFLPFVIKAIIHSLKEHPNFNASMDDEHEEVILKKYYNIGIAVDTDSGLMVPVLKGADQKSMLDIAKEIESLAEKARKREINLGDMKGGTFTITNVGSIGGIFATPIINYPEVAILAIGRIQDRLTLHQGKIKVRKFLPMSLAFDHRVVDGADAAQFMNTLKEYLEDPDLMLVDE